MKNYDVTIGLEIHAELNTKSKMFCGCDNASPPGTEPNINTCEVCTGQPGTLPVINAEAVNATVRIGLALGSKIPALTKWDRKHYFYPDLPKGYQISQYDLPLCAGGTLVLRSGKTVRITRVHLEEDTGKLTHKGTESLVDLNRAGTPLVELVTEPDITSAEEAKEFAKLYQTTLRYLAVSSADMERGEMRVEANISVRPAGTAKLGTKVEVKNLNSFRSVERAIEYEIERQANILEQGETVVQETRGFDEAKQKTVSQRKKEGAEEYRYFPEPDLPELELSAKEIAALKKTIPELPAVKRMRYEAMGVGSYEAAVIAGDLLLVKLFENIVEANSGKHSKTAAAGIVNDLLGFDEGIKNAAPAELAALFALRAEGSITQPVYKTLLKEHAASGEPIASLHKRRGMKTLGPAELDRAAEAVVAEHHDAVEEYRGGKAEALTFLIGQMMKATKGQADPQKAAEALKKLL